MTAIPHAAKHLAVWLAEPSYLTLTGNDVTHWTDSVSSRVMATQGANYPQFDGESVHVDDEDISIPLQADHVNAARIFLSVIPVSQVTFSTLFYSHNFVSLRLHAVNLYRSLDNGQDFNDFSSSTGRVWVNKVRTSAFSGAHVVSVEKGTETNARFSGLRTHFGARHPRTKYLAIIATSEVTDAEGDDITDWLMEYPYSSSTQRRRIAQLSMQSSPF